MISLSPSTSLLFWDLKKERHEEKVCTRKKDMEACKESVNGDTSSYANKQRDCN